MTRQAVIGTRVIHEAEQVAAKAIAEREMVGIGTAQCIWAQRGAISYRICTHQHQCQACEFAQAIEEARYFGGAEEVVIPQGFSELPGCQRMCRHALAGRVSYRLCTRLFQCAVCPFEQMLQEREL